MQNILHRSFGYSAFLRGVLPCLSILFLFSVSVQASEQTVNDDEIEVSYLYAAVMGSGTYKIKNRHITMFRIPFSKGHKEVTADTASWNLLLPTVIGYDDLSKTDSDWLEALLPDQIVTLTLLPGIEYIYPVNQNWQLKPFLQLGGGADFSLDQGYGMSQLGLRSLNYWLIGKAFEIRWGNSIIWAGEYQFETNEKASVGLFETGLDVRRDIPLRIYGRHLDIGTYYIYQRFLPRLSITRAPDLLSRVVDLHEFGLSVGLKEEQKLLGIPIQRVLIGYKTGGNFDGWTIGASFPF